MADVRSPIPMHGLSRELMCVLLRMRVMCSEIAGTLPAIEVSQSRDISTSHTFVTPYWRSSHSLPGMLWYGVDIVKVFI